MRHLINTCSAIALWVSTSAVVALDWPQWRGPDRSDVSKEAGLLQEWPEGGPKQLWLFKDAGLGYSGVAVVGDKLFTMGGKDESEFLICVDVKSGKQLWSSKIGPVLKNRWGGGPRGTPTVDGANVYALSGEGVLVCAQNSDGKILWQHTMKEYGGKIPGWGYTESPLVDGDKVVCTPGGSRGSIVALDKISGKTIWQSTDFTDPAQYSSIITIEANGVRQYIQLTMTHVVGLSAKDGAVLWTTSWPGDTAVIPTPIFHEGYVYVTAGYGAGCKLVKIEPGNKVKEVYENKVMKNHHGGVVLVGEHLYGHSDGGGWVCQDFKTGKEVWSERRKLGKGAVSSAEGMLYCLGEDNGTVVLVEASPKGWTEHGRFKLDPQTTQRSSQGKIWTHPVVANGKLFLRDQELLFCFDIKKTQK